MKTFRIEKRWGRFDAWVVVEDRILGRRVARRSLGRWVEHYWPGEAEMRIVGE